MSRMVNTPRAANAHHNNCAIVALAAVTGRSYNDIHPFCVLHGWNERSGMSNWAIEELLERLGYEHLHLYNARGLTIRQLIDSLPERHRVLVTISGHILAIVDGRVTDTAFKPRARVRQVISVGLPGGKPARLWEQGTSLQAQERAIAEIFDAGETRSVPELAQMLDVSEARVRGLLGKLRGWGFTVTSLGQKRFRVTRYRQEN